MTHHQEIAIIMRQKIASIDPEVVVADGFDDALLGLGERAHAPRVAIYDRDRCIRILIERDNLTYHEAQDFFDFNVACSFIGDRTPIFLRRP